MKWARKYDLLLIIALAVLVRVIYVFQLAQTPFFSAPIVDAEYHDAWAREILTQGIGHEEVYFRAPLYPYFLAFVYYLSDGSYLAARLAQVVLGMITAVLTYVLAWNLTRRRSVALLAGVGAAFYGMLVYYDGELLVETLFIPLLIAACLLYTQARKQKKLGAFLLAGVSLGLASITRPNSLILLPIWVLDIAFLKLEASQSGSWHKRITWLVGLGFGCSLPILPVTWHNLARGDFVLIASQGGINFYLGNNPHADGLHALFPGAGVTWDVPYATYQAVQASGGPLKASEVSAYYFHLGWQFLRHHPLAAGKLWLKKCFAFWHRLEVSNNRDLYFFESETKILPYLRGVGFWMVGPLGLLGWWIGVRRKWLPGWLWWFIPFYMVSATAFFVTARFRAPLVPFLLICAGMALMALFEKRSTLFDRVRLKHLALLLISGLFVNVNLWDFQKENEAHSHFALGGVYLKQAAYPAAQAEYEKALQADSLYPQAHLNLGVLAYLQGDYERAEEAYQKELHVSPQSAKAYNNLGALRLRQKRLEDAARFYEKALELAPYYTDARLNLAQSLFQIARRKVQENEITQAIPLFARAIDLDANQALYHYNFALALGRSGYPEKARTQLEIALHLQPDLEPAHELLQQLQSFPSRSP